MENEKGEKKSVSPHLREIESRQFNVEKICKEYESEITETYKSLWPNENSQNYLKHAELLESQSKGLLWCKVPKAAATSWAVLFVSEW